MTLIIQSLTKISEFMPRNDASKADGIMVICMEKLFIRFSEIPHYQVVPSCSLFEAQKDWGNRLGPTFCSCLIDRSQRKNALLEDLGMRCLSE